MKFSRVQELGLRLVLTLARHRGQMTLAELAAAEKISGALAARILGRLREEGLVVATRGRSGGYELAQPADRVTIGEVLMAMNRPLLRCCATQRTPAGGHPCPHDRSCGLRPVLRYLEAQIEEFFKQFTLADLNRSERVVREQARSLSLLRTPEEAADVR